MVTGYDARESRYNINQELLALFATVPRVVRGRTPALRAHRRGGVRAIDHQLAKCKWKKF